MIKKPILYKRAFIFVSILTLVFSFIGATSMPSNYIFEQIVGWSWGSFAILAFVFKFILPKRVSEFKYQKYAKYILAIASLVAIIDLIFI